MWKKKGMLLIVICALAGFVCSCKPETKSSKVSQPDLSQVRSICNLATLECYYHNVAKSTKTKGQGLTHLGEKDRVFWIEYSGIAKIGIDMSKVQMSVDGDNIRITIPNAEILSMKPDESTLNEGSFIFSQDGINPNKITAQDQTYAVNDAQRTMEESIRDNPALLLSAQERAQKLIENYINKIGESAGITYHITWKYEE